MAKKRSRLRLVSPHDPANVFDDLDALRRAQTAPAASAEPTFPKQRRQRSIETFARFPHERALTLHAINGAGWRILVELDWLILKGRGRNPVRLTNHRLRGLGISRWNKLRQLRRLEAAGVVRVQTEGRKWTVVTHLWFPAQT
jgi:hypothetical protein